MKVAREAFEYELRAVERPIREGVTLPRGTETGEVVRFLYELVRGEPVEVFGAVFFNARGRTVGYTMPYRGTTDRVGPEKKHLLIKAWSCEATSMVLFHNHPRGLAGPSDADIRWTEAFLALAIPLEVAVLDHLILAREPKYWSMAEHGTVRGLGPHPGETWSWERASLFDRKVPPAEKSRRRRPRPKYRDPETGDTWAGRGSMAKWLMRRLEEGARLEDFAVSDGGEVDKRRVAKLD